MVLKEDLLSARMVIAQRLLPAISILVVIFCVLSMKGEKKAQDELGEMETAKAEVDEELKTANSKLESLGVRGGEYLSPLEAFKKAASKSQ